jgi:hypothetical protein
MPQGTAPNFQFGTGAMYAYPNQGNLAANPTPYKLGTLQEIQLDVKGDLKKLFGQKQFAVATARGKIEVTCKAKYASQDPTMLNQLYWGQTQTTGMNILAADEPDVVGTTGSPPVANQVTVLNAANIVTNYGVIYQATGQQLILVTGAPAQGQYQYAGSGQYVFNAADNGASVLISYTWFNSTRGTTTTLVNQYMGYAPEFRAFLFNQFRNQIIGVELYCCTMGSFNIPSKMEDFWISDVDFEASTDSSDTLGKMYADLG